MIGWIAKEKRKTYSYCLVAWSLFCLISACAPTTRPPKITNEMAAQEAERQKELAVSEIIGQRSRLYRVAFRLLTANAPLCGDRVTSYVGFLITSRKNIDKEYRDIYTRLYGVEDRPTVIYVVPNSPADLAGLEKGDVICAINHHRVPAGRKGMKAVNTAFRKNKGENIVLTIKRNGEEQELAVKPILGCDYDISLRINDQVNAFAYGEGVIVYSGMMRFLTTDDELALIVGHELAHNTMGHIKKQTVNMTIGALLGAALTGLTGVNVTETGAKAGRLAFSQEFEAEADYVGCYYAARAGYDVSGAAQLWRRIAATHPSAINLKGSTHPSTAKRFIAIEKTAEEIEEKIKKGEPLIPEGENRYSGSQRQAGR